MQYSVTTLRTLYGSTEKITTLYPTLSAAETAAEAFPGTAIVRDMSITKDHGQGKLIAHFVNGIATGQTVF